MTELIYLNDTYLYKSDAIFQKILSNDRGNAIILDKTIFYPQGGGQPADTGTVQSNNGEFTVTNVRLDKEGTVWHFGQYIRGEFHEKESVQLFINKDRRNLNSKLHSAGHLVNCAVERLGLLQTLKPGKAYQFPPSPYIEYEGMIDNPLELIPKLNVTVNELVHENHPVITELLSSEEAERRNIYAPKGKPARIVTFSGFTGSGCGGTHLHNSGEVGTIDIRNIKCKNGITRMAYLLS